MSFRLRMRKACRPVHRISMVQPRIPHRKKFFVIMGIVMSEEGGFYVWRMRNVFWELFA